MKSPVTTINFKGHKNVLATNKMTLEVTKEDFLTPRGDCIIGIMSNIACKDLPSTARELLINDGSRVEFRIEVEHERFSFIANGSSALTLTHPLSMVIRRSSYICSRTMAIKSSASACDLPRSLVKLLTTGATGVMKIYPADI